MPSLSRGSLMPLALCAAGALSVFGYGYLTRDTVARATSPAQVAHQRAAPARLFQADERPATPTASRTTDEAPPSESAAADVKPSLPATPENVATWVAQATGSDAVKRAAAIEALGAAPKADAVPVLERVLETADDADRPRALQSLRKIAQREGDADNRIRNVVRKIVFHTDDEAAARSAQAMLDEIERDSSQPGSPNR